MEGGAALVKSLLHSLRKGANATASNAQAPTSTTSLRTSKWASSAMKRQESGPAHQNVDLERALHVTYDSAPRTITIPNVWPWPVLSWKGGTVFTKLVF